MAFVLDFAAFPAALLLITLLSNEPVGFDWPHFGAQFDMVVVAGAMIWVYAMGLYRAESLRSPDLRLPMFAAFCLSILFAMALSLVMGRFDLISDRWLMILPTAFAIMFVERWLFCQFAGLRSSDVRLEKARRQLPLDSIALTPPDGALHPTRSLLSRGVKRAFDVTICISLLIFTLPVSLAAILAILAMDGRPIFYRQERVGRDGRHFLLYKFRTMCVTAESDGVARWAQKHDDRVTKIGYFLRRSRIDEIPQFLNVLLGDMSLVGPRPERPQIVRHLEQVIPNYPCRHLVKPGITGWAQINYPYGASVADAMEKTKHDFYYIKNGSLILDAIIILQTVRVILTGFGSR